MTAAYLRTLPLAEDVKTIGFCNGQLYISEYRWRDFSAVMHETPHQLHWLAAPPWVAWEENRTLYNELKALYTLTGFHEGEFIEVQS